jgi:putative hydrolase of the HAD superfamily
LASDYDVLLFDLGGVIVELTGLPIWKRWLGGRLSDREIWESWIHSPAVRRFESGGCDADEFAMALVREFDLPVDAATFLEHFEHWPRGTFRGALELLAELRVSHRVACFSNTNALHWPVFRDGMGLGKAFHHCFASHELGATKPDREAFDLVLRALDCAPGRVLFLDDNQINVDGARQAGLDAHLARGPEGARDRLARLGVLPRQPPRSTTEPVSR